MAKKRAMVIQQTIKEIIAEDANNNRQKAVLFGLADEEIAKRWRLEYLLPPLEFKKRLY